MRKRPGAGIRPYRAEDRPQVIDLAPRLVIGVAPWRDGGRVLAAVREWIEESIVKAGEEDHALLVAEYEGRVAGFISLSNRAHFAGDIDGYIGELVTAEDMEGRGIGTLLVEAGEQWAIDRGLKRLTLDTGFRNTRARRFYKDLGYIPEDISLTKPLTRTSAAFDADEE